MIITKGRIRHNGKIYTIDEEIEDIEIEDAQRLVDLGVAIFMQKNRIKQNELEENEEISTDKEINSNIEEELELIEYNDLKTVAQEVGLEFKGNISRKDLISLILEENKASEILEMTEVEEDA